MKKSAPFLGKLLRKIAPRIGAKVVLESRWGFVGQITFKNGKKRYFRNSSIDLNTLGASEIAKDKDYANLFLKKMGYPTIPESKPFYSRSWGEMIGVNNRTLLDAYRYAEHIKFPVFVKPNNGNQGDGVAAVFNKTEFYRAMKSIFRKYDIALVQKKVTGRDYRIVVLDKKIISAYERIPLNVIGDGKSTILSLLKNKQKKLKKSGRNTIIKENDPRIKEKLKRQKWTLASIPKKGEQIFILDNANLSTGGDSIDVTNQIHPDFKKIAIDMTHDMGLRLCGVDLMVEGTIKDRPKKWWVLEINSALGLDHYVTTGKAQQKIVESMYLKILKRIGK